MMIDESTAPAVHTFADTLRGLCNESAPDNLAPSYWMSRIEAGMKDVRKELALMAERKSAVDALICLSSAAQAHEIAKRLRADGLEASVKFYFGTPHVAASWVFRSLGLRMDYDFSVSPEWVIGRSNDPWMVAEAKTAKTAERDAFLCYVEEHIDRPRRDAGLTPVSPDIAAQLYDVITTGRHREGRSA